MKFKCFIDTFNFAENNYLNYKIFFSQDDKMYFIIGRLKNGSC